MYNCLAIMGKSSKSNSLGLSALTLLIGVVLALAGGAVGFEPVLWTGVLCVIAGFGWFFLELWLILR